MERLRPKEEKKDNFMYRSSSSKRTTENGYSNGDTARSNI